MIRTDATLYLPVSDRLLSPILHGSGSVEEAITGFAVPQLAALVVLQCLPKLLQRGSISPARLLADTIENGNTAVERSSLPAFTTSVSEVLDRAGISAGCQLLPDFGIAFLTDEWLEHRDYLTPYGNWDSRYTERHNQRLSEFLVRVNTQRGDHRILTREQSVIYREIQAQIDERIHVQGYAGSGKTSLIASVLTMLRARGGNVLVLTQRQAQLERLRVDLRGMEKVATKTFGQLAAELIPVDLTQSTYRYMQGRKYSARTTPDADIIEHLGIHPSGDFTQNQIVQAVRSTVYSFCQSGEAAISPQHLRSAHRATFDRATIEIVLAFAEHYWRAILSPHGFRPLVRDFHRIKWVALNGWMIPDRYTHVVVDESHDLSEPMLQILDRSPQAVLTLGDEYQNLEGRLLGIQNAARCREVTHSVRSGKAVEEVVNRAILAHPSGSKLPFHGNALHKTEVESHDGLRLPDKPVVILVNDMWGLFEWAQRLAANGVEYRLLSGREGLNAFVIDCIELYKHRVRPSHPQLFRFCSWEELASKYHSNRGFQRIDQMLNKGYSHKEWQKTLSLSIKPNQYGYGLGLIKDARNLEFDAVMLASEVVKRAWDKESTAAACSALYVAATRAKHRLVLSS